MNDFAKNCAGPAIVPTADELREHYAIGKLVKIYALGIDERDYQLCRSAFAPDAVGEVRGTMVPIEEYVKYTYGVGTSFHATQHLIAQQYIQMHGDEAEVWSYGIAHHKVAPGEARDEIIAAVQYRDRCRRFDRGWLITERRAPLLWMDMAAARTPSTRVPG
jgi:SnoaL-like domain